MRNFSGNFQRKDFITGNQGDFATCVGNLFLCIRLCTVNALFQATEEKVVA